DREEKLAVAILAVAGGAAVVVVGRGRASGLHVQVEVGQAVVDGIERNAELVRPGRHVDRVRSGGGVVAERGVRLQDGGPRVTRRRHAAARRVAKAGTALRLDPGEIRGNVRVEGEVAGEAVRVAPARCDARDHGAEAGVDEQRAAGIAVARVRAGAGEVPADRRGVRDAVGAGRGR